MLKRLLKNSPLYLLALTNLAFCIRNGFNWVGYVALSLAGLCLALDIWRGIQDGKKQ